MYASWAYLAGPARAQTPVRLEVAAKSGQRCLTEATLRAELDRRYAPPAVASPTSDIVVRVESRTAGQASLHFSRGGKELGTRHFTSLSPECDIQRTVISIAILVAVDEIARGAPALAAEVEPEAPKEEPPEAPPEPQVPAPAAAPVVTSEPADAVPAAKEPSRRAWKLSMAVALERDLVPGWAVGGRTRLTTELGKGFSLRMEGWGAGNRSLELGDRNVRVRLLALGPGICMSFSNATVALPLCVGVLAGVAIARGDPGQPESRVTRLPWSAATLNGSVRFLPERLVGPILSIDTFVHLARPRLTAQDDAGATIEARNWPSFGASVSLGAEVRLR